MGPSTVPTGAKSQPLPSVLRMNGSRPLWNAMPIPVGFAAAPGALVGAKSMPSPPTFFHVFAVASQYVYFLRSDHGLPSGSAEARVYSCLRFPGHAQPQFGLTQPSFLPG